MSRRRNFKLIVNGSATSAATDWPGGRGMFSVEATFGGGNVSLQSQLPNGTWFDVGANTTLTANGAGLFELPAGPIRAAVTTATAVYADATGIPVSGGG